MVKDDPAEPAGKRCWLAQISQARIRLDKRFPCCILSQVKIAQDQRVQGEVIIKTRKYCPHIHACNFNRIDVFATAQRYQNLLGPGNCVKFAYSDISDKEPSQEPVQKNRNPIEESSLDN